jgi:hypothetical protein
MEQEDARSTARKFAETAHRCRAVRHSSAGGINSQAQRRRKQPSPFQRRVSLHITLFGACSALLLPACSPSHQSDPLHRRLQSFPHLHDCSDCCRLERKLPGGSIPHWKSRLCTAHVEHGARRRWGWREDYRIGLSEMWPGNTADVTTLIPVIDRLRAFRKLALQLIQGGRHESLIARSVHAAGSGVHGHHQPVLRRRRWPDARLLRLQQGSPARSAADDPRGGHRR